MRKKYKSEAFAAIHEAALGLSKAGLVSKRTMRTFDERCLMPIQATSPVAARGTRSQKSARFAACGN